MHDIYEVIDLVELLGLILISSVVVTEVGIFVAGNIEALASYVQAYGVRNGVNYYLALGTELTDGDDDEYRQIAYADEIVQIEEDVWVTRGYKDRGNYLDEVSGNNLGHNFPVIDRLDNRVITSIKSFDPSLKSYQSAKDIFTKVVRDANKLSKFDGKKWGKMEIKVEDFGVIFTITTTQ